MVLYLKQVLIIMGNFGPIAVPVDERLQEKSVAGWKEQQGSIGLGLGFEPEVEKCLVLSGSVQVLALHPSPHFRLIGCMNGRTFIFHQEIVLIINGYPDKK